MKESNWKEGDLIREFTWEEFRTFVIFNVDLDDRENRHFSFQSKGQKVSFGEFLNEDDKLDLQQELKRIIAQAQRTRTRALVSF